MRLALAVASSPPAHSGPATDNYLLAPAGRLAWREPDGEKVISREGAGVAVAVADGAGSGPQAEVAARAGVRALARLLDGHSSGTGVDRLHRFLIEAHRRMQRRAGSDAASVGTGVALCWSPAGGRRVCWAEIGTPRALLVRDGAASWLGLDGAGMAVRQRWISGDPALDGALRIELGVNVSSVELALGDRLVLMTDGAWHHISPRRLAWLCASQPDADRLAEACESYVREAGGQDAASVAVLAVDSDASIRGDAPPVRGQTP